MRFNFSQLKGLKAYTANGQKIGIVDDVIFDIETHAICQYYIRERQLGKFLNRKSFLVHKDQVVSISLEKMVVKDGVVQERSGEKIWANAVATGSGVMTSDS